MAGSHPRVFTAKVADGRGLFAMEHINPGELIVRVDGVVRPAPTRFSIQVGVAEHLDVHPGCSMDEMLTKHLWWFLNHHCEPNAKLVGYDLIAVHPIGAREEITFNYNTTEIELFAAFACGCGSSRCVGEIRGFKHLEHSERERLKPLLGTHLLALCG